MTGPAGVPVADLGVAGRGAAEVSGGDATATGGKGGDASTGNTQVGNGNAVVISPPGAPDTNGSSCDPCGRDDRSSAKGGDTSATSGDASAGDGGSANAGGGEAKAKGGDRHDKRGSGSRKGDRNTTAPTDQADMVTGGDATATGGDGSVERAESSAFASPPLASALPPSPADASPLVAVVSPPSACAPSPIATLFPFRICVLPVSALPPFPPVAVALPPVTLLTPCARSGAAGAVSVPGAGSDEALAADPLVPAMAAATPRTVRTRLMFSLSCRCACDAGVCGRRRSLRPGPRR